MAWDPKSQAAALEAMRQRMKAESGDAPIVFLTPTTGEKMSEVITAFAKPFMESVKGKEAIDALIGLAVTVWNSVLLPENEAMEAFDAVLDSVSADAKPLFSALIVAMLERRESPEFANCVRMITYYELHERAGKFFVTVASTPDPAAPPPARQEPETFAIRAEEGNKPTP